MYLQAQAFHLKDLQDNSFNLHVQRQYRQQQDYLQRLNITHWMEVAIVGHAIVGHER